MFLLCKQTTGPILKEAFEIDRDIIIQKYEADWEDFVDLGDFVDDQDRWGTLN